MSGLIKASEAVDLMWEANRPSEMAVQRCARWMDKLDEEVRRRAVDGHSSAPISLAGTELMVPEYPGWIGQALDLFDEQVKAAGYSINKMLPSQFAACTSVTVRWA